MSEYTLDEVKAFVQRYPGSKYPNGATGDCVISQITTEATLNGGITQPFLLTVLGKDNLGQLDGLKRVPGFPN